MTNKDYELILIGDGNFDYYLEPNGSVRSVPKEEYTEGHGSYMGGIIHLKRMMEKEYIKGKFTELGKKVLGVNND